MKTNNTPGGTEYIVEPLTQDEIDDMMDSCGHICVNVPFKLNSELIKRDIDEVNDLASEKVTGDSSALMDIDYVAKDTLVLDGTSYVVVEVVGVI